jgi:hypothetical protein
LERHFHWRKTMCLEDVEDVRASPNRQRNAGIQ